MVIASLQNSHYHQVYEELGFFHVREACSAEDARSVSDLVRELHAKKHGLSQEQTTAWYTKSGSGVRLYGPPSTKLKQTPEFQTLVRRVLAATDREFGAGIWQLVARVNTTIFMNWPNVCGSWTVPASWHSDFPQDPADPIAKVLYVFAFLETLEPGGGGTMILQGSSLRAQAEDMKHCMGAGTTIAETRSQLFMETLAESDPWFKELFGTSADGSKKVGNYRHLCNKETSNERVRRFMTDGTVSAGIQMKVVELVGNAGDLVFWDPRCLHTPSNNRNSSPRVAIRFRLDRVSAEPDSGASVLPRPTMPDPDSSTSHPANNAQHG